MQRPFDGANTTCYLAQFFDVVYVMNGDASDPSSVHIYDAAAKSWSKQAVTTGGFDPNKPTVVMLHPLFLDSSWLYPQMDDHRLNSQFNIIVFDTRSTGKSISRPTGKYDLWVTAADLAFCFHVRPWPAPHYLPDTEGEPSTSAYHPHISSPPS